MRKAKLCFIFLVLLTSCSLSKADGVLDLDTISWRTNNLEELQSKISSEMISDFINQKRVDWHPITADQIGDYRWIDVDGNNYAELFVTVALSRRFFNVLFIFENSGRSSSLVQKESVWMLESLDLAVKDLDKDGFYELILPKQLSSYRGADSPIPVWKSIYKWQNGKFVVADSEYLDFYKDLLPSLDYKITETDKRWSTVDTTLDEATLTRYKWNYERLRASHTIIRDKILRLLSTDPIAGYKEALLWAKHPDRDMRENAITVFEDILDQNSKKQLQILAKDNDPLVADAARFVINKNKTQPEKRRD